MNQIYRDHKVNGYVASNGASARRVYRNYVFVGWQIFDSNGNKLALAPASLGVDNAQNLLVRAA